MQIKRQNHYKPDRMPNGIMTQARVAQTNVHTRNLKVPARTVEPSSLRINGN
jgi:hypothetical protein